MPRFEELDWSSLEKMSLASAFDDRGCTGANRIGELEKDVIMGWAGEMGDKMDGLVWVESLLSPRLVALVSGLDISVTA